MTDVDGWMDERVKRHYDWCGQHTRTESDITAKNLILHSFCKDNKIFDKLTLRPCYTFCFNEHNNTLFSIRLPLFDYNIFHDMEVNDIPMSHVEIQHLTNTLFISDSKLLVNPTTMASWRLEEILCRSAWLANIPTPKMTTLISISFALWAASTRSSVTKKGKRIYQIYWSLCCEGKRVSPMAARGSSACTQHSIVLPPLLTSSGLSSDTHWRIAELTFTLHHM